VKINIHEQLFISRQRLAKLGLVSVTKRMSLKLASVVLSRPWLYRLAGRVARTALRLLPRSFIYSRLNMWGRQRELPPAPPSSFRELHRKRQQERHQQ
jgi:L-lactate dehydrogenase complex protein LldF